MSKILSLKKFSYFLVIILSFMVFNVTVKAAALSVSSLNILNYKDVVQIKATQGNYPIAGYYVGTSLSTASFYSTNALQLNVSMMNGTQSVWVKDTSGAIVGPYSIKIEKSCTEQASVKNATGSGTVEKCMVYANGQFQLASGEREDDVVVCADGYSRKAFNKSNYCSSVNNSSLAEYNLNYKYCRMVYQYNCVKATSSEPTNVTSYLSGLQISSGTLSPAFSPTNYNYNASVNVSSLKITASINSDGSSLVEGYGNRTVNLAYGKNTIYVKVQSKTGNITTYTLNITRVDNRSKDNTLSSLSVTPGTLSPVFSKNTVNYNVSVGYDTTSIVVDATLNNGKSSFIKGYGPRTVSLNVGNNVVQIKVKSESNATKTYTINVNRKSNTDSPQNPTVNEEELALLSSLKLSEGKIDFNEKTFEYTIYVDYSVTNVLVLEATPKNSSDTVTYAGGENLTVGVESQIMITVEDKEHAYVRTYSVNVIRKEEDNDVSTNSSVSDILIKGHNIKFEQSKGEYEITLGKKETELEITVTPEDSRSTVAIEGNQDLKMGSEILVTVTAEDGSTSVYKIVVAGMTKGANIFLVVLLIIVIILVIGYIVLRLLGYKVVINLGIITTFFRRLGQKIKNIFDR